METKAEYGTSQLEKLAGQLEAARMAEASASRHRVGLEEQIAALVEVPDEGQKTHAAGIWKITVKGSLSRKADYDAMRKLPDVPANLLPIRQKDELDMTGLKWLEANMPEVHAKVLRHITTKPNKVWVSVTKKEVL